MDGGVLVEGRRYAFREKRIAGSELLQVKLIEKVGRGGKLKVRFETGRHPGLEEYVSTRQLLVPWGEAKSFLQDERRQAQVAEECRRTSERVLSEAASEVLGASGERAAALGPDGYLLMPEDDLQRIMDRAGVNCRPQDLHRLGFLDCLGNVRLPFEASVSLARSFAAAEPETVLMSIDDYEEQLRAGGYAPGERYQHRQLRNHQPAFAVARQWAGLEHQTEILRKEIGRLRGLVSQAAYELRVAGKEQKARRLLRAVDGS
jgi:hypothetical protein